MKQCFLHRGIDKDESFLFFFSNADEISRLERFGTFTFLFEWIDGIFDFHEIVAINLDCGYLDGSMHLLQIEFKQGDAFICPKCNQDEVEFAQLTVKYLEKITDETFLVDNVEKRELQRKAEIHHG